MNTDTGDNKPRVLMVGPGLNVTGGISAVVNNWLTAGLGEKVHFTYIASLTESRAGLYPGKLIDGLKALGLFFIQMFKPYDVVHIHLSYGASFYRKLVFFLLAKLFRKNILVHLHGSKFEEFYDGAPGILKRLISYMFSKSDCVLVLSQQWKRFVQCVFPGAKTQILFNGSFPREIAEKTPSDDLVITFMGRLGERKGTYDLIEAIGIVNAQYKNLKVLLCGDGDIEKVETLIGQKGLGDVISVPGWVSGKEKEAIYLKSKIFILPSYNEGLPVAILEAMSYGLPVISTRVGGIPEAVEEGVNGLLIDPGDIGAMSNAIEQLLDQSDRRRLMGIASQELIKTKFNIYTLVDELLGHYKKVMPRVFRYDL